MVRFARMQPLRGTSMMRSLAASLENNHTSRANYPLDNSLHLFPVQAGRTAAF